MADQLDTTDTPFGSYEEEAIVALIIDHPEFFSTIGKYLDYRLFKRPEVQYVVAHLLNYHEEHDYYPSRGMLNDLVTKKLTVDDPSADEIIEIIKRPSNPRDIPGLKSSLMDWTRKRIYAKLWDPETVKRYQHGDYEHIEKIVEEAGRITDLHTVGLDFFNELEKLFTKETTDHFTTGIPRLDRALSEGGPSRGELLVIMAPTGVGKSLFLANMAFYNVTAKRNVLYITLEMSDVKSAIRILGSMTNKPVADKRFDYKEDMIKLARSVKASGAGDLLIYEYPPDEISVTQIYSLIDDLNKQRHWKPDLIIIDYLELMVSRRATDNEDDYTRQKQIATQVCGLAKNTNTVVYSATQTNRSGNDTDTLIGVSKAAESYGKTMPISYLITINQSKEEYEQEPASARLYIAKNRDGPKFITIPVRINYKTMAVKEIL